MQLEYSDYSRQPKAAWYGVKEAYRDDVLPVRDSIRPINLKLQKPNIVIKAEGQNNFSIVSNVDAKYVYLYTDQSFFAISDNYFNLKAGVKKMIVVKNGHFTSKEINGIHIKSLYDIMSK
jgi:beta-mannosidase